MAHIKIVDLEIYCRIDITEKERAAPQRLLVTVDMTCDISRAAETDRIEHTIDYFRVAQDLTQYASRDERSWCLVESLASQFADLVFERYRPESLEIEIKKFPLPKAAHVSVCVSRTKA